MSIVSPIYYIILILYIPILLNGSKKEKPNGIYDRKVVSLEILIIGTI